MAKFADNGKDENEVLWTDKKRTLFGLPISFTRYILTGKKFITRKGFLSISEDEIELYRVVDKVCVCLSDRGYSAAGLLS